MHENAPTKNPPVEHKSSNANERWKGEEEERKGRGGERKTFRLRFKISLFAFIPLNHQVFSSHRDDLCSALVGSCISRQ